MQRNIRNIIEGQTLVSAETTTTVRDAAQRMRQAKVGAIAVVEREHLAGVFTERDALVRVVAEGRDATRTCLGDVMTRNPVTCHPDQAFAQALQLMHQHRFRHVPVVEDGRVIGMVSARDAMGSELEAFIFELLRQEQSTDVLA